MGGVVVGTWGVGPLANDSASDVLDSLRGAAPDERKAALEGLLSRAISEGQDADPSEVIAAGAIVAASLPGSPAGRGSEGPADGWLTSESAVILSGLAARAIDVCLPEDGWYWDSWTYESDREQARETVAVLRASLG